MCNWIELSTFQWDDLLYALDMISVVIHYHFSTQDEMSFADMPPWKAV